MNNLLVFLLGVVCCQIINVVANEIRYRKVLKRVKEIKIDVDKTLSEISEMIKKEMEKKQ